MNRLYTRVRLGLPHDLTGRRQASTPPPAQSAAQRFDLVVATNVLLYYDVFDQALAASNIAHMMAKDGLLITNTRIDDIPALPFERVLQTTTPFSDRPGDGEHVFVYELLRP